MAKGGGSQTVTNKPDPVTQRRIGENYNLDRNFLGLAAGPWAEQLGLPGGSGNGFGNFIANADPSVLQAQQTFGSLGNLGLSAAGYLPQAMGGLSALAGGDASAFFNPYQDRVIQGMNDQYDRGIALNHTTTAQDATRQGAFGGSRQAVAQSLGDEAINRDRFSNIGNLLYSGYNSAFQNGLASNQALLGGAMGGANLGLGAAGASAQIGQYLQQLKTAQNSEQYNRMLSLLPLLTGATGLGMGSTTTQSMPSNFAGGVLGGAATGAGIGSVIPGIGTGIGAGIGAGIGLLGGIL